MSTSYRSSRAASRFAILILAVIITVVMIGLGNGSFAAEENGRYAVRIGQGSSERVFYTSEPVTEEELRDSIEDYVKKSDKNITKVIIDEDAEISMSPAGAAAVVQTADEEVLTVDQLVEKIAKNYYVDITTVAKTKKTKKYSVSKKTIRTKKLRKTTKKTVKGKKGTIVKTYLVTSKNGKVTSKKAGKSYIQTKAVPTKVYKGTGSVKVRKNKLLAGTSGDEIVAYAKKFVGNPYRYGGCSLTRGTDCSGFVYSVYRHFGLNVPRVGQSNVGKRVSLKKLKKGDVISYSGHVAIYAGNGKIVHASNPRCGIIVSSINYSGRPQKAARYLK